MGITVSVVVPTYRRVEYLGRCLQALVAQDFDPSAYEIIVVDDGADDATRALVEAWAVRQEAYALLAQESLPLVGASQVNLGDLSEWNSPALPWYVRVAGLPRLVYLPASRRAGPAAARNLGWQAALGEIIAFTDDDCIPDPGWLKNGVKAFTGEVAGASGRVEVPLPPDPTDYELNATGLSTSRFVTANCFYRRSAIQAVGGFDERFTIAWREDSDLFFHMQELGYELVDAPEALVVHPVRPARWRVSLSQQRKSRFNALLYQKHPQLYREWIQPAPPWQYYRSLLALLAIPAGLALSLPLLSLAGLLYWLGATVVFCARRLRGTSHSTRHVLEMLVTSALIPPLAVYWRLRGALKYRVMFL